MNQRQRDTLFSPQRDSLQKKMLQELHKVLTLFGPTCGPMRPTLTILANCMKTTGSIGLNLPDFS